MPWYRHLLESFILGLFCLIQLWMWLKLITCVGIVLFCGLAVESTIVNFGNPHIIAITLLKNYRIFSRNILKVSCVEWTYVHQVSSCISMNKLCKLRIWEYEIPPFGGSYIIIMRSLCLEAAILWLWDPSNRRQLTKRWYPSN